MSNGTAPRTTTTRRPEARPVFQDDAHAASFSHTLIVGVVYGLVAWFHLVLCPAYVVAGLLSRPELAAYSVSPDVWALTYVLTGALMVVVAAGLVASRPLAWRIAPWCVLPNLVAHLVFITVLPLWGLTAIACDVLALWLVAGERRRRRVIEARKIRPTAVHERARTTLGTSHLLGNRRPT